MARFVVSFLTISIACICVSLAAPSPSAQPGAKAKISANDHVLQQQVAQSKSFNTRSADQPGARQNFGTTYSRPIQTTTTYSTPTHTPQSEEEVKILPLPIPVGLPQPGAYHTGAGYYPAPYGHFPLASPHFKLPYGYPYTNGLFGGFGGPLTGAFKDIALGKDSDSLLKAAALANHGGFYGGVPFGAGLPPFGPAAGLSAYGNDPVKASLLAGRSNPLIHLLAAPYIKNIKENNGEDLPTLEDLQELLERSSFGLTGIEESNGF